MLEFSQQYDFVNAPFSQLSYSVIHIEFITRRTILKSSPNRQNYAAGKIEENQNGILTKCSEQYMQKCDVVINF